MEFAGILIGLGAFIIIGVFHPVVIKTEYYIGKKAWPVFLALGLVFAAVSLYQQNLVVSSLLGVLGFSCFWSIQELFEQEKRVKKGWFPANSHKRQR